MGRAHFGGPDLPQLNEAPSKRSIGPVRELKPSGLASVRGPAAAAARGPAKAQRVILSPRPVCAAQRALVRGPGVVAVQWAENAALSAAQCNNGPKCSGFNEFEDAQPIFKSQK
ncbi:hypothetical protein Salat_0000400 [Sesamum alatum]|uniref:Uncharacterized protein n=1 Tax=Sesamum alatum TaxID=300844 RepID=A0AAE1YTW2_9LAMI|nr:hypothetical protein Salat_0000400 [Sesamum alatum]